MSLAPAAETHRRGRFVVRVDRRGIERALLWLTAFSGFLVLIEPSPYELVACGTIGAFLLLGLRIPALAVALAALLAAYNIGAGLTLMQVVDRERTTMWVLVSIFLAATSVFYAMVLAENTKERLDALLRGYVAAAVVASACGVIGYFNLLPGSDDLFTKFGRVKGTFKDPNVYGPFVIMPAMVLLQGLLIQGPKAIIKFGLPFAAIAAGLFLSFSRAAWGHLVFSAALMAVLTFVYAPNGVTRRRIIGGVVGGGILAVLLLAALLSIESVRQMFEARASLSQSYDTDAGGRFDRYLPALLMAFDHPFGIGTLEFGRRYFSEEPHNTYISAFMNYGWLGGLAFPALVVSTLFVGFRTISIRAPWQLAYISVLSSITVTIFQAAIIDIDHWRHFFLGVGLTWGLAAASAAWQRRNARRPLAEAVAASTGQLGRPMPASRAAPSTRR